MEIREISKIQFRQDSYNNFYDANPTLAKGEPALVDDNGVEKLIIGDGESDFRTLIQHPFTQAQDSIEDAPATGELYARLRLSDESIGNWFSISDRFNRKTLADLLKAPYDTEIDMGYSIRLHGQEPLKQVYGKRYYFEVTGQGGEPNVQQIDSGIEKIVDFGGTIKTDADHEYIITSKGINFSASVYTHQEQSYVTLNVLSVCDENREDAPIDIWVLYTRL